MPQVRKKSFIQKNGLIAVWSMAGFMAMGYIGFLATGTGDQNSSGSLVARNSAPPATAKTSPVQQQVAALRAHVEELTSREKSLAKKLSNIEEALGPNTASLPEQKTELGLNNTQTAANVPPSSEKSTAAVSINVLPLTQDDHITEFSGAALAKNYGVFLAKARSVDSLERHWKYLKETSSGLLSGLKPHFISKGTTDLPAYSLIAGPFGKLSDARGHCQKLSKVSIDCQETQLQTGTMDKIHTATRSAISK